MTSFTDWLKKETKRQGWSNSELGRRLGLASSAISLIFTGTREPSYKFCMKLAKVLDKPPVYVLRVAGLLPSVSEEQQLEEQRTLTEAELAMVEAVRGLQGDDRAVLNRLVELLAFATTTAEEKELLAAFRSLGEGDRGAAIKMINALADPKGLKDL